MNNASMTPEELKGLIRTVPDFPKPGIQFRDITTLIGNGEGLSSSVHHLANMARASGAQKIAGMEARLTASASLLPRGVEFAAVGYGCTSASSVLGSDAVATQIRAGADVAEVTNPLESVLAACRALGQIGDASSVAPAMA